MVSLFTLLPILDPEGVPVPNPGLQPPSLSFLKVLGGFLFSFLSLLFSTSRGGSPGPAPGSAVSSQPAMSPSVKGVAVGLALQVSVHNEKYSEIFVYFQAKPNSSLL